jgi:hypothetical protein
VKIVIDSLALLSFSSPWKNIRKLWQYRRTSLNARDRDQEIRIAYKEFAYKKTKDACKLRDRFLKKGLFSIAYRQNH